MTTVPKVLRYLASFSHASKPFFSRNSICFSTIQDGSHMHKCYHNKQPRQFTRALQTMGHNGADMERFRYKATVKDSSVGIQETNLKNVRKGRTRKWTTSYSKITIREAEKQLGFRLTLPAIPIKEMIEGRSVLLGPDMVLKAKQKVYEGLVGYLNVGGYPTEADPDFKEANINDIVVFTIYPILNLFKSGTTRKLHLSREKEITSIDSNTSGMEECVVMDYISHDQAMYVLIVEAKKVSLGQARKQCFLTMKDMWDCNGGGTVYGFITMGDDWRMVSFDGKFKMSQRVGLLFETMAEEEERWMADYSILIDCFNVALSYGAKEVVEVV